MHCKLRMVAAALGVLAVAGCAEAPHADTPTEAARAAATVIRAVEFGLKGDAQTDDGPAIRRMLAAAAGAGGPVRLAFPAARTIRVTTAPQRYVFRLNDVADLTIDGGGSTFLLAPEVRFLRLTHSRNVEFRNLNIDFAPLPFADGTVAAVNAAAKFLDVRLAPSVYAPPAGGPTRQDGEQAFFSMLWYPGPYGRVSRHYWTERMEQAGRPGTLRVHCSERFRRFDDIKPGTWLISLPVPGIAHRYGPGGCLDIFDNDTVTFENVELWSAPWFGFRVMRNTGEVTFRRVHIRPKPGTGRLTSTWRDGFHVKGNSAKLLWEDCILSGMNDDAFNISTHCSRVRQMLSPREVVVLQAFALNPMPWRRGATFAAADFEAAALLGTARIVKVTRSAEKRLLHGKPAASPVTLLLDRPIEGLAKGAMVWQPESSNPRTTLRRCRIENSCRLQTPVTLDACDVTALLWFHAERVEGPFPSNVTIRDCRLRRGRGNPRLAVSFAGGGSGKGPAQRAPAAGRAIHDIVFERNEVWGDFSMIGVDRARLADNAFLETGAAVRIEHCTNVERTDRAGR